MASDGLDTLARAIEILASHIGRIFQRIFVSSFDTQISGSVARKKLLNLINLRHVCTYHIFIRRETSVR